MRGPGREQTGIVFLGLGFELVALCITGYYLGQWLDTYMGWQNFASTYLVLVLLIGWFIHMLILLIRFEKENERDPES